MKVKFLLLLALLVGMTTLGAGCVSFSKNDASNNGPAGIFASTDRGESWQQITNWPTLEGVKSIGGISIYRMIEDPQDPSALYLATRQDGLFYTFDEGNSWQQAKSPLNKGFVYSVAVHPKNKCLIYVSTGQQVFKTDDCMRSWQEIYRESRSNIIMTTLAFNQFSPYEFYIGESNGDLLRSNDSGVSWKIVKRFGDRLYHVESSPLQSGLFYVITKSNGLYRSDDGGNSWVGLKDSLAKFSKGLEYRRHLLHPTKPDSIYWISTYGILRSDDRGESWYAYDLIHPPGSASIYAFAVNPKNDNEMYYTATINSRSTFYKTLNGGKEWITRKLPTGQLPISLRVHPEKTNILYMAFTIPPEVKEQPKLYIE